MTGGIVAAKYPADKHISTAAMTLVAAESRRSINEYGNSASRTVIS
jgi:hypothetical protein